jgi:glycosyltransferase involved in cell wall biosynthesis
MTIDKNPLVSIVMPTYNDALYLSKAIEDIINQTYKNFEFIIVNDGSSDNSSEILEKYSSLDSRIKIFNKKNGGTGSALNLGFSHANGKYGTWVSSDDEKEKEFIEDLVSILIENPDSESVTSSFISRRFNRIFKPFHFSKENNSFYFCNGMNHDNTSSNNFLKMSGNTWADINNIQCFSGVCFMFDIDLKRKCGDYINLPGEDYHMAMKMALNCKNHIFLDKVLGSHNNPSDSLTVQNEACVSEANRLTRELYNNHKAKK